MNGFKTDIIIVGAGIVGLTLANLCAKQDLSIAIVEKQNGFVETTEEAWDLRCFAISPFSQQLFETLGIWDKICEKRASPYKRMEITDAISIGKLEFCSEELGFSNLGHIIENKFILSALWDLTKQQDNIHLFLNTHPQDMIIQKEKALLQLDKDVWLESKLIVGAEGTSSFVREAAKIALEEEDYGQHALICHVKTEYAHCQTARQRFLPKGPLAFLPLSDPHLCSIVWTLPSDEIHAHLLLSEQAFAEAIGNASDHFLGRIQLCSERKAFSLKSLQAKNYVSKRVALVGDALHCFHPLAGLGLNVGLQDAATLAQILHQAVKRNVDIGQHLVLRKYERARKVKVMRVMMLMKFLKECFSKRVSFLALIRSLGMQMLDKNKPLKRLFMKEAVGV